MKDNERMNILKNHYIYQYIKKLNLYHYTL